MVRYDKAVEVDTTRFECFEEVMEHLENRGYDLFYLDTYYLHDTADDVWYSVGSGLTYSDFNRKVLNKEELIFDEIKELDWIQELNEILIG